jgi:large subunit ribosomal protein L15
MKLKKTKKVKGQRGLGMGTHGSGARKNKRKSGNKGGIGMAGSGKRADHKKTLVQKRHGHNYFGKSGVTRGRNVRDIRKRINIGDIQSNLEKYGKKKGDAWEIELKKYKVLGTGEVKEKINLNCLEISVSAKEKIEKARGTVKVKEKKLIETPTVENPKHKAKAEKSQAGKNKKKK